MRIVIVEDEGPAAAHLKRLLSKIRPEAKVPEVLSSVKKAVSWFASNPHPDLVLMDIQLSDGLSFEIFEQTSVDCPIIFTTAFNEYAIRAFKVNSVDYLLKPIDADELEHALVKFETTHQSFQKDQYAVSLDHVMQMLTKNFKQRFVIRVGEHIRSVPVEEVLYFYSMEKATFLHTADDHNYVIDYSLDQVEELIDPEKFFRINRKYILRVEAIDDIITYSNSRLKIELKHSDDQDVIVARERVNKFKAWLDR